MNKLRLLWEIVRIGVPCLFAWWLLRGDYSLSTLAVSTGTALLVVAISHINRRVLFYRIDLQHVAQTAIQSPVGAAIVFAAIVYFLVALVNLQGGMLIGMLGK